MIPAETQVRAIGRQVGAAVVQVCPTGRQVGPNGRQVCPRVPGTFFTWSWVSMLKCFVLQALAAPAIEWARWAPDDPR